MGANDVRVRALASALSHGTEMLVYRGEAPRDLALDLPTLDGSYAFPIKFGYASAGRVAAIGADVDDLLVGDTVFVHHPHQDEYVVPAASVVRLPRGLDPLRAVFFANTETAVNILLDAHPRTGDVVAVFGQGVVGLLVTQLLRRAGVTVVAVEPVARRRELALRIGAHVAVAPDDAATAIRDVTRGRGADLAIEVSGNPRALQSAIDVAAFQATIVVASWYGTKPVSLDLGGRFHRARLRLVSSQVGAVDPGLAPRWDRARRTAYAVSLLSELELTPLVTHRFPYTRAAEAYALVDGQPDDVVQVLLTYA
ncbi:MAG TPA: zinc-binding alcohol dehydrogenase [Candidatus Acidoferrales bacterium]|nr:zinc-binding alcohol dehydrogenase [Candidatus Acidoferrales bacterium]